VLRSFLIGSHVEGVARSSSRDWGAAWRRVRVRGSVLGWIVNPDVRVMRLKSRIDRVVVIIVDSIVVYSISYRTEYVQVRFM